MSLKTVYAIASAWRYYIEHMDIKTAYLYDYVEEVIYVELRKGISRSKLVCRLRKALYSLRQGARVWDKTLSALLIRMSFKPLTADHSVFIRVNIIIVIYVDDLLLVGPDLDDLNIFKKELSRFFQISELGAPTFYLEMSVTRDREAQVLSLSQGTYIKKILQNTSMQDSKPVSTPVEADNRLEKANSRYEATPEFRTKYQSIYVGYAGNTTGHRICIVYCQSI